MAPDSRAGKRRGLLAAGLIVLATAAAFSNSFAGPLIFDDKGAIPENLSIRRLWPVWAPLCPPNGETVTGRPILNFSFAVNYAVSDLNVRGYHATNLAIHLAAALLLFGLLRRTLRLPAMRNGWGAAATPLALAVALLWAVHPLQTESVTYVVQRAESLVGLFYLLTLYGLVRGATAARPLGWYVVSALACLLGMASKEVMVSAPLVALLYDRTFLAGSFREAWRRRYGLYLALSAGWLRLAWLVAGAGGRGGTAGFAQGVGCWAYLCTQFGAIVHYLCLSAWPHPLVLDYGDGLARTAAEIVPYAMVVGLLALATVAALWQWPKVGFLGACFFALLAPTSSIVPVVTQTIAEHRMYLPLAAVLAAAVLGGYAACRELARRGWISRPAAGLLFGCAVAAAGVAMGTLTFQRNKDYQSELSIWQDTAGKAPTNARAQCNLGVFLTAADRLDEAIARLRRALKLRPDYADAHNNLGNALAAIGRLEEAVAHLQKALQIQPDDAETHYNFGNALAAAGRLDEAIAHFRRAVKIRPDFAEAHSNLGIALATRGRLGEAMTHFRKALEGRPDDAKAINELAWLLATCPEASLRDGAKAVELARRAEQLTGGKQAEVFDTLAAAYAAAGRFQEALAAARKALDLATKQNQQALADGLRLRIALYESGRPFLQPGGRLSHD